MAEIKDQIGRIGNFQDAAIEKLSSMLNSAVGKAVKYASEQSKASEKDYEKLSKALEDLGDDLKESLKATEKFVDQVKEAVKSFEKVKKSRGDSPQEKGNIESIQREQTKILGMILENQKRAQSAKLAKYTTGGSSIASKVKLSLGDLGFKPKGADRVPAMLSPNEFIVNSKSASRNRGILERINKGYSLGGLVKPRYLSGGGNTAPGPRGTNPWSGVAGTMGKKSGGVEVTVEKVTLDAAAASEAEKIGRQLAEHVNKGIKESGNKELASWLTGMSTALMGGKADLLQGLFTGSVTDATEFQREMRLIAFQTQGITGDFREMQGNFSDLGKVAAETGKSISLMQKVYMSNLKKGFKDNKEGMKVMKSGLFLSTMIGSEAQQTADLFGDWHRTLALSSNEMSELSRGMRNVALSTGVTGDELLGAMKSSEGILKNLRNQGNLTAGVSKTVIEMMAEAKKTGFDESTGKVLNALSSTGSIMEADSATQGLIYTISNRMGGGATDSVLSGTFMKDRENLAGFSAELMGLVGNLSDGAIKSLQDFDKLSDAQKRDLTLRLRGYGLTIAQAQSLISTTQKASKGLAGNIEDLDKIGSSKFATKAEKELASKQKSQAYLGASLDYLAAIGDEAKDKSLSDALKDSSTSSDFKDKRQDFTAMAGAMTAEMKSAYGIGGTNEQMAQQLANLDPKKAAELNALVLGDQLNKAAQERGMTLDKDYSSEIKKALASGDNAKFRELVDEAQKKASEIAVDQQASTTPEEKLALEINKLNETIRGYTSSFVRGMVDYIGWMGLLLIQIGLLSTALYATFGKGLLEFSGVLGTLFPKGGIKGFLGRMSGGMDDMASTIAKSSGGGEGLLKKFMTTFTRSRNGGLSSSGLKGLEFSPKGFGASLKDATDELGNTLKDKLVKGVEGIGKKGNRVFNKIGNRVSFFGKQMKESFSGAWDVFKKARKGSLGTGAFGRGGAAAKGIFSSLTDAGDFFIKNMTGKAGKLSGLIDTISNSKVIKTTKGAFDSLFTSFAKGKKAYEVMRSGSKNPFYSFAVGFDQFFKNVTGGMKPFEKMSSIFSGFFGKIKNFKLSSLKSLPGALIGGVKTAFSGGVGGIIKGIGPLFKGGMKGIATGLRGALAGGTLGLSQIIFGAVDMVFGAVTGFQNTGKNFEGVMKAMGKSTKDLTWGMYASSTIAGGLTGILDGLTFGMLRLTGVADFLEQALSLVFYSIFSVIEGFISGIMVAVDMVKPALKSLYDSFAGLGNALLGLFNAFAGIFGVEAKNAGQAFAMLYNVLKPVGKAIGMIVGVPLGAVLWTIAKVLGVVVNAISITINMFTLLVKAIVAPFKWLYNVLVGHSIIPDLCTAIVGIFGAMALKVLKGLGSLVVKAAKFMAGLPFRVLKGLNNVFFKAPAKIFGKIFKHLSGKTVKEGLVAVSGRMSKFFGLFGNNLKELTNFFSSSWFNFLNTASGGMFGKIVNAVKNSKIASLVDDFLIKPIAKGLSWLGNKAGEVFSWAGKRAKEVFGPAFNWIKGQVNKLIPGAKAGAEAASKMAQKGAAKVAEKAGALKSGASKTVSNATKSVDDLAKAAPTALGFLGKSSSLIKGMARKLPVVGPMLDFGIRTMSGESLGKATAGTAAGVGGGLGGAALGATIGTMIFPGVGTAIGGLIGGLAGGIGAGMASDALYDKVVGTGGGTPVQKAAETASAKVGEKSAQVATPVGQHAIPVAKPSDSADVGAVQPVHLRDITDSILRERASTSGTGKVQSDELSRIEEASFRQVEELEQIKQGIADMVALLKPKGSGVVGATGEMGPGRTKDPKRPLHAAQFGKMKYGKAGGNANRSLVNNGEV